MAANSTRARLMELRLLVAASPAACCAKPMASRAASYTISRDTTLIRVHDLRLAKPTDRFVQSFRTRRSFQCDREPRGQHLPAEPVEQGNQINKLSDHGDVGNVHRPDLIGTVHRQLAQQIRIYLVAGCGSAGVRPAIERLYPHHHHASRDVQPTSGEAFLAQKPPSSSGFRRTDTPPRPSGCKPVQDTRKDLRSQRSR